MIVKPKRNNSPFVVDQPGSTWFFYALVLAGLLGSSFRLYFSEQRVNQELRLAFARLEPELKLQFAGAKLSLDEGWLWPQVGISISDLQGSYQPSNQVNESIELRIDEILAPINFWALIRGRLELKVLELGHLTISMPSASWSRLRNQTLQLYPLSTPPPQMVTAVTSESSQYQPVVPKPVSRVRIKSLRLLSDSSVEWPFEFRQIKFDLDSKGRAEIASELFFPFQHWGSLPSLPLFFRWNPEDRFISVTLSGRFREGHLRLSGTFDFAQDFFNFEFLGRTLPVSEVQTFLKKWSQSVFFKTFWADFPLRYWLEADWPGWLTLEVSSLGYLSQDKSAQVILRNTILEEGEQKWEVGTLTGNQNKEAWTWGSWKLQAQGLTHQRAKAWLPLPTEIDLIQQGIWQAQLDCNSYFNCLGSYVVSQAQLKWGPKFILQTPSLRIGHLEKTKFEFKAEQIEIGNWMTQKLKLLDWSWTYQPNVKTAMRAKQAQHLLFKGQDFEGLDFNLDADRLIEKASLSQVELVADSQVPNESLIWPLKVSKVLWQPKAIDQIKLQLIWPNNKKITFTGSKSLSENHYLGFWEENSKSKKREPSQTILNW